jgi:hypothetical protein
MLPILPSAFCSAWSRTEQVLMRTASASFSFGGDRVAALGEHARDLFRVALVHLATVGADVDFGHETLDGMIEIHAESLAQSLLRLFVIFDGVQKLMLGLLHESNLHRARSLSAAAKTSSKGMPISRP